MADNSILVFRCLNPACAQMIKLNRPARSGVYPVTCPYCKVQKKMNIKGLDAFSGDTGEGGVNPQHNPGVPDNSAAPVKTLKDDFLVGELYKFMCPHCGKQELGINSPKPGKLEFSCQLCKGRIEAGVRAKTKFLQEEETCSLIKGKLVLLRKGWMNKDYPLGLGQNVVGRYDEEDMPDIAVKKDNTVSRRSVRITVEQTIKGYTFKLTVLKATNPVLHNNLPLSIGESISLNFGDTLILGKTKFRFEKNL